MIFMNKMISELLAKENGIAVCICIKLNGNTHSISTEKMHNKNITVKKMHMLNNIILQYIH